MAILHPDPVPGPWNKAYPDSQIADWKVRFKEEDRALKALEARSDEALKQGEVEGLVYKGMAGDGYIVAQGETLTVQHAPYGDRWELPAPHIRGLTAKDVVVHATAVARLAALFKRVRKAQKEKKDA